MILGKEQERLQEEVRLQQEAVDRMAFVMEAVSRAQVLRVGGWGLLASPTARIVFKQWHCKQCFCGDGAAPCYSVEELQQSYHKLWPTYQELLQCSFPQKAVHVGVS